MKKIIALALWISATGTAFAVDIPHWDVNIYCEDNAAAKYSSAQASRIARADCLAKQIGARDRLKYMEASKELAQECAEQVAVSAQGNYVELHKCIARDNK